MNIAILHSGDLKNVSLGGVDRYIKSLILFSKDNEITVFGTTRVGEHKVGEEYQKVYCGKKYKFIPISTDKNRPLSVFYMVNEIKWVNKLGNYDCIYAQRTEYSLPFLFSKNKKKLIEMIHGSSKYSDVFFTKNVAKVHLLMEKLAISIAARTFIILNRKEFGVPYYKKKYPKYAARILYGRNPIDTSIYKKQDKVESRKLLNLKQDEFVVLFSGRVEHSPKRVLLFPDICRSIVDKGIKLQFVVIGEGSTRQDLINKIKDYNLSEYFILPGYIDDPKLISLYNNAADITINISMFEGTCTSNLEAIACGVPVVSTDVGDINECIFDGENGAIINNGADEIIIKDAVNAIIDIYNIPPSMNKIYMKYDGKVVMEDLKHIISLL